MDIEALLDRYPSVAYLKARARSRMPHFAWEYLDSGTGLETAVALNHSALDRVRLTPALLRGAIRPDISTTLFGRRYAAPLGVAPIGLCGMMWPGSERMLAAAARRHGIAYCLSTVGCATPEEIGAIAGADAWFQLYPFADRAAEADVLDRAGAAGFSVLMVTVDVPQSSTRERQRRAGFGRTGPSLARLAQIAASPHWVLAAVRHGAPRFRLIEKYVDDASLSRLAEYIAERLGVVDTEHLKRIRDRWKGPLVVKGILSPDDAETCVGIGVDGIVVSNHGGRQLDAAPAAIDALARIAPVVGGRAAILFDSGVRTGLDVARALALGADFVLAGRAFVLGVAALGEAGADLVARILVSDLANNMAQLGCASPRELPGRLAAA